MEDNKMPRIRKRKGIQGYRLGNVMDHEITIATWNVRTLNRVGAKQDLKNALQRYNIDITALQEIRWKGNGQDEDDMYYSCYPTNHEFGVGFAVRGKTRFCITRWTPINERLCMLRIKIKFYKHNLRLSTHRICQDFFYKTA